MSVNDPLQRTCRKATAAVGGILRLACGIAPVLACEAAPLPLVLLSDSIGYPDAAQVGEARKALEPHILASTPAPAVAAVTWSDRARAMLESEPLGGSNKHRIKSYEYRVILF